MTDQAHRARPQLVRRGALAVVLRVWMIALIGLMASCGGATEPHITVTDARMLEPATDKTASVYLNIVNDGGADTLIGASSSAASSIMLHGTSVDSEGRTQMTALSTVEIGEGATVSFAPGKMHLMVMSPPAVAPGDTFPLTLRFLTSGEVTVQAKVVREVEPQ
jgi:copper(I)-binding protein